MAEQQKAAFDELRELFKDKAQFPDQWTLLEADALALGGAPDQALVLLKEHPMELSAETNRLLRLALLSVNEHPQVAWDYLTKAYKTDPSNADMRLYRAHLLSAVNKEELAKKELVELVQSAPDNPFYKEELADHYLRTNNLAAARELLEKSLLPKSSDELC